MKKVSIRKLRKVLLANTVWLSLIVSSLLMSLSASFARANSSSYNAVATATFIAILKDIQGKILNPPDTNAYDLQKGDILEVIINGNRVIGTYQGNNLVKVNNIILQLTFQSTNPNINQPPPNQPHSLATGASYTGVIHNVSVDETSDMTLSFTSVTQSAIKGTFKLTNGPLAGSGPFTGSINNQSILFTSIATDGSKDTIKFAGIIHTNDSSISGLYSASSPTITTETGIWYVMPKASYPSTLHSSPTSHSSSTPYPSTSHSSSTSYSSTAWNK